MKSLIIQVGDFIIIHLLNSFVDNISRDFYSYKFHDEREAWKGELNERIDKWAAPTWESPGDRRGASMSAKKSKNRSSDYFPYLLTLPQ